MSTVRFDFVKGVHRIGIFLRADAAVCGSAETWVEGRPKQYNA